MACRICQKRHKKDEMRNLNIYVFGSEGVSVCHSCEMGIVEYIRAMAGVGSRAKLQGYRDGKSVHQPDANTGD